jgi:hypothetical protein
VTRLGVVFRHILLGGYEIGCIIGHAIHISTDPEDKGPTRLIVKKENDSPTNNTDNAPNIRHHIGKNWLL